MRIITEGREVPLSTDSSVRLAHRALFLFSSYLLLFFSLPVCFSAGSPHSSLQTRFYTGILKFEPPDKYVLRIFFSVCNSHTFLILQSAHI